MMAISDWPEDERPREKLLKLGADALTDAELLAIFLRVGVRGKSAVDLARDLLNDFRGLVGLLSARQSVFCQGKGLGMAKYVQLQAVLEMSRRYLRETLQESTIITSSQEARDYLALRLRGYQQEVFAALLLNNQHRVIHYEELFFGTIHGASVHPREIVRIMLHHNAAAVIFAHNHPSGVTEPSQADLQITKRLQKILEYIDIRVLDHCIIGAGECLSFSERGLL
jgi:DNA repair protein RadC